MITTPHSGIHPPQELFGLPILRFENVPTNFDKNALRKTFIEYLEGQIDKEIGLREQLQAMEQAVESDLLQHHITDATYPLYGGTKGNDYFQFYRNKVIRPMLALFFKNIGTRAKTREELKQFVEVTLEMLGRGRERVAKLTKSLQAEKFGVRAAAQNGAIYDDVVFTGWMHHMQLLVKNIFLNAFDRLGKKAAHMVTFDHLLAEVTKDPDFYVYKNENSKEQSHGLPFNDAGELCYIYPKKSVGATFLIRHSHWKVGQNLPLRKEELAACFDPKNYLSKGFTEEGKAYRHRDQKVFDLRCCHMQIHTEDTITVDTLVEYFMDIFTFWQKEQGEITDQYLIQYKMKLVNIVIALSCGTFFERGQASIMEDILHGGFAGMFGKKLSISEKWQYDGIGFREKLGLDMRALSHYDKAKFTQEFIENVELV